MFILTPNLSLLFTDSFILDMMIETSLTRTMLTNGYKALSFADLCERVGTRPYVADLLKMPGWELEAYITGIEVPPTRVLKKLAQAARIPWHEISPLLEVEGAQVAARRPSQ